MSEQAVLLGYYLSDAEAREAFRQLRRARFRRALSIHQPLDGPPRPVRIPLACGLSWGAGCGLLCGMLAGAVTSLIAGEPGAAAYAVSALSALAGGAAGWWAVRRLAFRPDGTLLRDLARWLTADETVVIVQDSPERVSRALALLRGIEESPPSLFVLHPGRPAGSGAEPVQGETLNEAQLKRLAERLAASHRVEAARRRGAPLFDLLDRCEEVVGRVHRDLAESSQIEQTLPAAAEWLLDNAYIIQGQIEDVRHNLPGRFYRELPVLASDPGRGEPRCHRLAAELIHHTSGLLNREVIDDFIAAYQSVAGLTIGELWAFPQMLRIGLLDILRRLAGQIERQLREREWADFWANRLLTVARRDPNRLFFILAELARAHPDPSPHFAFQITGALYDEESALVPVRGWLERKLGDTLGEIVAQEQARQAADQVAVANAVTSIRHLTRIQWRECFEAQSKVEALLRLDPAGVYGGMDFETRDRYRHAVEEIARGSAASEEDVARAALEMASEGRPDPGGDPRGGHVGMYLVDEGRPGLVARLGGRERWRRRALDRVRARHTAIYLSAAAVSTAAVLCCVLFPGRGAPAPGWPLALLVLFALFPASELGLQTVNYLVTRLVPPRPLPKMSFEKEGVPDEFRTLVVVPMLLFHPRTIRDDLYRLEMRYLGNAEPNILFGLFSDLPDAEKEVMPGDDALLREAVEGIEALNAKYEKGRFYLFHRGREWVATEGKFIGWERKRGKIEELNRLLSGLPSRGGRDLVRVGDPDQLANVRYVITVDSDTHLPRDGARRMIETIAHPLNRARAGPGGGPVRGGYCVIQPRVSITLPSAMATPFSRLFTDPVGTDPYTHVVSDVYQDLAGEASYLGKGIYDPRVFHRVLAGRFPEQRLLSHDLIEGAHVRVGLASDVELFEEFPADYLSYLSRQHRWICGDWQIADWCLPRVPSGTGSRAPNPLSALNRWKIFDNLRRSLVPAATVLLLAAAWLLAPSRAPAAALLAALLAFIPPLARLCTLATTPRGSGRVTWRELRHGAARAVAELALAPYQAVLAVDAVSRVWYRRLVSGRRLLEWTPAQLAKWRSGRLAGRFLARSALVALSALGLGAAVWRCAPSARGVAAPFLALWIASPLLVWRLCSRPRPAPRRSLVPREDARMLREVARQTWRFFDDFVGPGTAWLPPDNYQVSHQDRVAHRTSPTNIGLWLLGVLAAYDFGYVACDDAVRRVGETLSTMEGLERHEGHFLNWYDIEKRAPYEPRYVSTVDSGNLLACLWTLDQGLAELSARPLLGPEALRGLHDTLRVLNASIPPARRNDPLARAVEEMASIVEDPPARCDELAGRARRAVDAAAKVAREVRQALGDSGEPAYWASRIERQAGAWKALIDRYLPWVEILASLPDEIPAGMGDGWPGARRAALEAAPSARSLASGEWPLAAFLRDAGAAPGAGGERLGPLRDAVAGARNASAALTALADEIRRRAAALAAGMDMRFLYHPVQRLFSIGFNAGTREHDGSFYDLLASEARLGSFVAIARGDAPCAHWMAMGRPFGTVGKREVLLSWGGTMFEYLMPLLLQRAYPHSLLDMACREAVAVQAEYARRLDVPWGISESAYADLDAGKTYQYKAFGVPGLGLKRGLEHELVVAPYASMLALAVDPAAAARNLAALEGMGLRGGYGFFDAIDFTRQRAREGGRGVIVRTYMAHHQAMGLLAIDNFINDAPMQRRFHADPRVRAAESLLYERIPASMPICQEPLRERAPSRAAAPGVAPAVGKFETPHSSTPKTQLLSNGRYNLMITSAGGGYSRWRDFDLTRWRADTTRDPWGVFCYLRELPHGRTWCNTHHPVGGASHAYRVEFATDRVEFRRSDGGVVTETEILVSPEDDAEIRRIRLVNRSGRRKKVEVTSYAELALAPHNADRQHPAFSKLFVGTEAPAGKGALVAHRRPRGPDEPPVFAAHLLECDGGAEGPVEYETDRLRFLGRGRTPAAPAALDGPLSNSAGYTLDPIFSMRRRIVLEPGQAAHVTLVLCAAESRKEILALIEKYRDPRAVARAADLAWTYAQVELRRLRVEPDEARRFQQLAAYMLYPSVRLRPAGDRLRQNRLGQARLWPLGISGDLPIATVSIGESDDISLVRQMLQAHAYWRLHGLRTDLVILNEESSGYEQPLHEQLKRLVAAHAAHAGVDQPGGVFLRSVDQMADEDVALLLAAARVALVAARGPLPQQLGTPTETGELPAPLPVRQVAEEPSAPLPFMELLYFNGLGGFTPDGREYAIYLGPGAQTPAPWVNVMANPGFGALVSESGSGFAWCGNSQQNRLTGWSNDPVSDPPSEAIYIRDEETGKFWTPTALPVRELDAYRARHGAGYTVFEHNSHAIRQELVVFVPADEGGGEPVRLQRLRLRNDSSRHRRLSVTFYAEWTLGEDREDSQAHVVCQWDAETRTLLARNRYHPSYGDRVAFATLSPAPQSYTADRTGFLGRNRTPASPAAMRRIRLAGRAWPGLDPCAAVQVALDLPPGAAGEVTCMLGQAASMEEADRLVRKYRDPAEVEESLRRTAAWWDRLLGAVQVATPEKSADLLMNRWLPYQALAARVWGRTGFYQSSGAFGFRDQLQDVLALLHAEPAIARGHLLASAHRQFVEGDVQHWWQPPSGAGVRTRCSDDLLWLPYAAARYVRVTGDAGVLDERVPFIEERLLGEKEREAFLTPHDSLESATLLEHCRRALSRAATAGPHGLPLIGGGDWNDGMNLVGAGGRGESVWLAWFEGAVLDAWAAIEALRGCPERAAACRERARALAAAAERHAWDGAWYIRAFHDDGTPLGSAGSGEASIDSLAQSWAVLGGAADPARAARALASAIERLVRPEDGLALLLAPPFDKTAPDPGYIKGYPPGVRENGGQYTHAAVWLAMALCRLGDGEGAVSLLRMLNPVERARDVAGAARYRVEPYAAAADVSNLPGRVGVGGWTWYTGSAAWMYRAWIEEVLGMDVAGGALTVDPVIPPGWKHFGIRYRRGEALYEIDVENPDGVSRGVSWVELDGRRLDDRRVPLDETPLRHRVVVRMGAA